MKKFLKGSLVIGGGLTAVFLSMPQSKPEIAQAQSAIALENQTLKVVSKELGVKQKLISENQMKLSFEDVDLAIAKLEEKLSDDGVVERLNNRAMESEERARIFEDLKNLDLLRVARLERQLQELNDAVAHMELHHEARLKTYGLAP